MKLGIRRPWMLAGLLVASSGCGRLGLELLDPPGTDQDGGLDGGLEDGDAGNDANEIEPEAGSDAEADADHDADGGDAGCANGCMNAHGSASCAAGICVLTCSAGYADCDGLPTNGCEANIASDPAHCGACANACSSSNGSPLCTDGTCGVSTCTSGRGECDGLPATSCETDLLSSAAHCGFCMNACAFPNASASCVDGSCRLGACDANFASCDALPDNGCEVDLRSQVRHCGACGTSCTNANGTTSCTGGVCIPSCASGFGNCDGDARNGCETSLDTVTNCGSCRNACPANGGTPICSARSCSTVCDLSGTLALKVTLPLAWPSSLALASGSGTAQLWAKWQGTHTGNTFSGNLLVCGLTLPDFALNPSFGSEQYGVSFSNTAFDRVPSGFPTASASATLGGAAPGATLSMPATALLLGLSLSPPSAAWPSTAASVSSTDPDADGKPAMTGSIKTGTGYAYLPVDLGRSVRADRVYAAARVSASLSGNLTSCSQASGAATVTLDTHLVGCRVQGGSRDCSTTERDFIDGNRPAYSAGAASFSIAKVAATATCAQVRAALP